MKTEIHICYYPHILLKKGIFTPLWEELFKFSHLQIYSFADSGSQAVSLGSRAARLTPKFLLAASDYLNAQILL